MRTLTSALATVALGAMLTIGPTTMSMARGGDHGGSHGANHGHADRDSGDRGFGGHVSGMRGVGTDRGANNRGSSSKRPTRSFGHDHDTATYCLWLHHNYDPTSGVYFGPDGMRHFCP
jgi:hypothetical protein